MLKSFMELSSRFIRLKFLKMVVVSLGRSMDVVNILLSEFEFVMVRCGLIF